MTATKSKLEAGSANDGLGKKLLILIVNNKGGVGKSVVARALVDNYRTVGKVAHIYDTDGGTGSLLISYGTRDEKGALLKDQDPAVGIGYFDIRGEKSRNKLLDNLASGAPIIVCDMAGGSLNEISRIVDDGDGFDGFVEAVAELGYELVILNVLSNVQGATTSVRDYLNAFNGSAKHVAIINKTWGKSEEDFPFWYGYKTKKGEERGGKTRADFLAAGGREIHFPAMPHGTFALVDAAQMSFAAAAHDEDLTVTETQHVKKFNKEASAAFLEIKDALGL